MQASNDRNLSSCNVNNLYKSRLTSYAFPNRVKVHKGLPYKLVYASVQYSNSYISLYLTRHKS